MKLKNENLKNSLNHETLQKFMAIAERHQTIKDNLNEVSNVIDVASRKIDELMSELTVTRDSENELYLQLARKHDISVEIVKESVVRLLLENGIKSADD